MSNVSNSTSSSSSTIGTTQISFVYSSIRQPGTSFLFVAMATEYLRRIQAGQQRSDGRIQVMPPRNNPAIDEVTTMEEKRWVMSKDAFGGDFPHLAGSQDFSSSKWSTIVKVYGFQKTYKDLMDNTTMNVVAEHVPIELSRIKFSRNEVHWKFEDGHTFEETISALRKSITTVPQIRVVPLPSVGDAPCEYRCHDNRRLMCLKKVSQYFRTVPVTVVYTAVPAPVSYTHLTLPTICSV